MAGTLTGLNHLFKGMNRTSFVLVRAVRGNALTLGPLDMVVS